MKDAYATAYIQGLRDYMAYAPQKAFADPKLQRMYNLGRFIK